MGEVTPNNRSELLRHEMKQLFRILLHDMRNPLVNAQALTREMTTLLEQLEQKGELSDAVRSGIVGEMAENLAMMNRSIEQMYDLMDGASSLSSAMLEDVECDEVDLQALLARIKTGLDDNVDFSYGSMPLLRADSLALRQLFESLLAFADEVIGEAGYSAHVSGEDQSSDVLLMMRCRVKSNDSEGWTPFLAAVRERICERAERDIRILLAKTVVMAHGGLFGCELIEEGFCFSMTFPQR